MTEQDARERIAIDKIIEIQQSHINANIWAEENAVRIMDVLKQLGYTRPAEPCEPNPTSLDELKVQPTEPVENMVEAVAKLLYFKAGGDGWEKEPDKPRHYLDLGKETFRKTAREILKLIDKEG